MDAMGVSGTGLHVASGGEQRIGRGTVIFVASSDALAVVSLRVSGELARPTLIVAYHGR
jgi:hypothetical protein